MCVYMKMCRDEKSQGLQRMILFIELFAHVKYFGFSTVFRVWELLMEMEKMRKF